MKKAFLVSILFPMLGFAQRDVQVPHALKVRFMEDFTSAKQITWNHTEGTVYSVSFYYQSHFKNAQYSLTDTIPVVETVLTSVNQLPVSVSSSVKSRYKKFLIEAITKIEKGTGQRFQLLLWKDEKHFLITYEESGKQVSKVRVASAFKNDFNTFTTGKLLQTPSSGR